MKKVALLAPLPPPYGGIAAWTQRMLQVSLPNDWNVVVVDEKVIGERTVWGGKSKKSLFQEIKRCFGIWKKLLKVLKDDDLKIVQACIPAGITSLAREIVSGIITKIKRRKFIVHFRCTLPYMVSGKMHLFVFKILTLFSDEFFILNQKSADFLKATGIKTKFKIIPNFVSNAELSERRTYAEQIKTIVYVGGVIPEKGCDKIIEVAKQMPNIYFKLIGKIGIEDKNIPQNIFLLGEQNREIVHKNLLTADVFLFLTRFQGEGFSNALAEAMATGLPCIVSDWAANADMVNDPDCITNEEIANIIEKIEFFKNSIVRKRVGERNVFIVKEYFSENVVLKNYVDEYEKLVLH